MKAFVKGTKGKKKRSTAVSKRVTLQSIVKRIPQSNVSLYTLFNTSTIDGRSTLVSLLKKIPAAKKPLGKLMNN